MKSDELYKINACRPNRGRYSYTDYYKRVNERKISYFLLQDIKKDTTSQL